MTKEEVQALALAIATVNSNPDAEDWAKAVAEAYTLPPPAASPNPTA
jgi:hypothetical protein